MSLISAVDSRRDCHRKDERLGVGGLHSGTPDIRFDERLFLFHRREPTCVYRTKGRDSKRASKFASAARMESHFCSENARETAVRRAHP